MIEKSFIFISKKQDNKVEKNHKKRLFIYVLLLMSINLFLCINNLSLYKNNLKLSKESIMNKENGVIKEKETLDILKKINNNLQINEINIKNMFINKGEMEIVIEVENKKECLEVIRKLENISKIKSISPIIEENNQKLIKVILC